MKKTLKILGIALAAVAGLLVVAAIALSLLFDPNQYKGEVIRLVKEKTGRELKIQKKIGWSFFPRLGIEAGGLELSNAPGFGASPFARIDAAGVHVALFPLLGGRIDIASVYARGLELNLARDSTGRSNWADLGGEKKPAPNEPPASEAPADIKLPIQGLAVGALDIKRTTIRWQDAQSGSQYVVKNLSLDTSRFASNVPMDLQLGFDLERRQAAPVKVHIRSRMTVTPDSLKLSKLEFRLDDSRLTGTLDVRNFSSPTLRFDLALDRLDLDRYLAGGKAEAPNAPAPVPAPAAAGAAPSHAALRYLDIDGKFNIKELKIFGARTTDAKLQVHAKDGLIKLGPSSAKLYGGSYHGQPVVDARGKLLQLRLNEKLEQVQVGPLLKDMQLFDSYTGVGNITLDLVANGADKDAIIRTLGGQARIALHDGRIEGVDFVKIIDAARALSQKSAEKVIAVAASESDNTVFKSLTASAQIANGIARSDDIVLDGPNLRGTGKGKTDLVRQKLDYLLRVTIAESAERRGTTLPIRVGGTFNNPKFEADVGEYLKMQVQKQIEKQLDRSIGKEVGKELEKLLQPKKSRKQQLLEQQQQQAPAQ